MSSSSPFIAGDRVTVTERESSGGISAELSWTGVVVAVTFPWIRVRDDDGNIYERHARTLRAIDHKSGRTALTTVGGVTSVIAPARSRVRVEYDIPEDTRKRRRRNGPSELATSMASIAPKTRGRRKTATRLSELEDPSEAEMAAATAFAKARKKQVREATSHKPSKRKVSTDASAKLPASKRRASNISERKSAPKPGGKRVAGKSASGKPAPKTSANAKSAIGKAAAPHRAAGTRATSKATALKPKTTTASTAKRNVAKRGQAKPVVAAKKVMTSTAKRSATSKSKATRSSSTRGVDTKATRAKRSK